MTETFFLLLIFWLPYLALIVYTIAITVIEKAHQLRLKAKKR